MKEIKINTEFITLGQFLKYINLIGSGAQAKEFLIENMVTVNAERESRRGRKLYPGYQVKIQDQEYLIGSDL
ncbi:MAG: S4 domain-containing protein YaaA [Acholeplasmataceae bacterium]|nr:S4 domain-containing protein YaaA [Acholeplasmataceae bacterium]